MSRSSDFALRFLKRGWQPIPVPRGSKNPGRRDWSSERRDEAAVLRDFAEARNVGVLLGGASGGLVDVDLDSPEALALAPAILPATDAVFGRESTPRAHWLYRTNKASTEKFSDPTSPTGNRAVLAEIRASGMTVFPGSIHPSGEEIRWDDDGDPSEIAVDDLQRRVALLAAASLLLRHYPAEGCRHDFTLALAGGLLRAGIDPETAAGLVLSIAQAAGDEEAAARASNVLTTQRRDEAGERFSGWPTLERLLANQIGTSDAALVVGAVTSWLGYASEAEPEPPLSSFNSFLPANSLGDEAIYGLAGDFVRSISPFSEAAPAGLLSTFLTTFGSLTKTPYLFIDGRRHHGNIFTMLIGPTAKGRKGTALSNVRLVVDEVDPDWTSNCIVRGIASGEALIYRLRDKTEAEQEDAGGVDDKRLLVVEEEFATILRGGKRQGSIISQILRTAFDSGVLEQVVTRRPSLKATDPHVSVIGHITLGELGQETRKGDLTGGLMNRFLWVWVERAQMLPNSTPPPREIVNNLVKRMKAAFRFSLTVEEMKRDAEAAAIWETVYPSLSGEKPPRFGDAVSRGEVLVVRLSLIYALLDESDVIQADHLIASLSLFEYAEASAQRVFGNEELGDLEERILSLLRGSPDGVSRTEIYRALGNNLTAKKVNTALKTLSNLGLASKSDSPTGGRPTETWIGSTNYTNYTKNLLPGRYVNLAKRALRDFRNRK